MECFVDGFNGVKRRESILNVNIWDLLKLSIKPAVSHQFHFTDLLFQL